MNDSEFEDHLRTLRPSTPSQELEDRIARDLIPAPSTYSRAGVLEKPARSFRLWRDIASALAGAVAALVVINWPAHPEPRPAQKSTAPQPVADRIATRQTFEPAESAEVVLASTPTEEWVETSDGLVRAVRYQSKETHAWANPQTGARIELEVPRDNLVFLPVSLQ